MTLTFRTVVLDIPPSPHGLSPARIVIDHYCNLCHHKVATDQLGAHARAHNQEVTATN